MLPAAVDEGTAVLWFVAVLVVLVLVAVAVEAGVRHRAVQEAADRIASALEADVELHVVGRPLTWHLAMRHLPHVTIVADDLPVLDGRTHLQQLRVELDDIRLLGPAGAREVIAGAGRFVLRLTDDQLLRMVTLPTYLVTFSIIPRGLRLLTLAGVTVDASVRLSGNGLTVRAASSVLRRFPQPTFWLRLPSWPYGAVVEGMTLHDGWVEAWGTMDPAKLRFEVTEPAARRVFPGWSGSG